MLLAATAITNAAIINIVPGDNYTKIESAQPGDEVVIAPGTYAFRVHLTRKAPATNPIVIRALDPANRPVWDFTSTLVENAPGSYTAGDRGRGGWQFSGATGYRISGIVIRACRSGARNSAGIRYYNGSTNLHFKDCIFVQNDNGMTGGTQNSEATVEFCEFDANGNTMASQSSPTHNIYIYGGRFTLRYSYVHDPVQRQNFHIRCYDSTLEYNWFARARSYEGDLMTNDDFSGNGAFSQTMTLRGNVIVQSATPNNNSQVVAIFNDGGLANLTLNVRALYNTFVGNGAAAAFVHLANADGTRMNAELANNIIFGTTRPTLVDNAGAATVSGVNNWIRTNATAGGLSNSVRSASPGFRDVVAQDYTLTNGSACINAASGAAFGLPGREYFRNETTNRMWRIRNAARDIGAFESTSTGAPIAAYDPVPRPLLNISRNATNATVSWLLFASEFQLEAATNLNLPIAWTVLSSTTTTTNVAGIHATVPLHGRQFFQLRH